MRVRSELHRHCALGAVLATGALLVAGPAVAQPRPPGSGDLDHAIRGRIVGVYAEKDDTACARRIRLRSDPTSRRSGRFRELDICVSDGLAVVERVEGDSVGVVDLDALRPGTSVWVWLRGHLFMMNPARGTATRVDLLRAPIEKPAEKPPGRH